MKLFRRRKFTLLLLVVQQKNGEKREKTKDRYAVRTKKQDAIINY